MNHVFQIYINNVCIVCGRCHSVFPYNFVTNINDVIEESKEE